MTPLVPVLLVIFAAADKDSYAIVDVDGPDTMLGLAVQTTNTVLASAAAMKLAVVTPEKLRTKLDDKQYAALVKCGGQPACIAPFAGLIATKKLVTGSLSRDEKSYLLKLWLIDLTKGEVIANVDRQVLIAARRLQHDVEQAVPPLLRGEQEAMGTLRVTSNVSQAQLFINTQPVGVAPYEVQLKPGKYEIKLERVKYLSVTRLVNVEANEKTEVALNLLLVPGALPDLEPTQVTKRERTAAAEPAAGLTAPTWVAGTTTLAALTVAAGFGIAARAADKALSDGFNAAQGTYSSTRQDALTVQRNALVANVMFGVAGAAALVTALCVVFDVTRGPVQVAFSATGSSAGVGLAGAF